MEKMDLFRITQAHGYIFQIFFAEVLCTRYLLKKKNFLLRALTGGIKAEVLSKINKGDNLLFMEELENAENEDKKPYKSGSTEMEGL